MDRQVFEIIVKTTSGYAAASTGADVFIQLVGEDGRHTGWVKLNRFWKRSFKQGRVDHFTLILENVGHPAIVRLKLENKRNDKDIWGCDYVTVKYDDETEVFPVYDWISDSVDLASGKATLPQNVQNEIIRNSRSEERKKNESCYTWIGMMESRNRNWLMSRYLQLDQYGSLPQIFKYEDAMDKEKQERFSNAALNSTIQRIKNFFCKISKIDHYKSLYGNCGVPGGLPSFLEKWHEDKELGRQMLNSNNPRSISRCKRLPEHCKISDVHVDGLLDEGKSLDKEILLGHIYIVDHVGNTTELARANKTQQLYCADATALFYSSRNGAFLPIAIQLEPYNGESVFTPKDDEYDWLLAKMYFKCADHNVHERINHFGVHLAMEPIAISLFRCLPRAHPIYKLLRPHLRYIVAANHDTRDAVFNGILQQYQSIDSLEQMNKGYEDFDFADLNFPENLKDRGVMDSSVLPNYHFRDDGMLYWDVIESFVGKVIEHFYKSDEDVHNDYELQNWINEIALEGFAWDDGYARKCPGKFKSIKELQTFVTVVIFTNSVHHAAVHFPQFQLYKFIPNAPGGMRLPIHKKGEGSLERVLGSLPDVEMSTLQIGVTYITVRLLPEEPLLGEYPMQLFTEPEVKTLMKKFASDIEEVGNKIRERNNTRAVPYNYLLPERIPATITA